MTHFLKILRSYFFILCIIIYTVVGSVIIWLLFFFSRRGRYMDFATRVWSRLILRTCGVIVTAEGLENLENGKTYIFVANHQSHFDIPACYAVIPARLRMLAKKELFRIPVFGWDMWAVGHIRIDRENREKAIASLDHAVERLKNEDISPVVYPEGTRSPDGKIHTFKKGASVLAIKSGRSIVPVTIIGSRSVLPKKSVIINPGYIHIIINKPIASDNYGYSDRSALIKKAQEIIEKSFYKAANKKS